MVKPLTDFSAEDLEQALQWAKDGAKFDNAIDDVPKAAQAWVCEQIELVRDMFAAQDNATHQWQCEEIGLSDIDQPFREIFTRWIHEVIHPLKDYYERHKDTGVTHWRSRKRSTQECQEAFEFLASGKPVDRLKDLPSALRTDVYLDAGLEIYTRHLEKKERDADWIASGFYNMSRTEKNIDAECIESIESGLYDCIHALEERLCDLNHQETAK